MLNSNWVGVTICVSRFANVKIQIGGDLEVKYFSFRQNFTFLTINKSDHQSKPNLTLARWGSQLEEDPPIKNYSIYIDIHLMIHDKPHYWLHGQNKEHQHHSRICPFATHRFA